eukprot:6172274-Pleurochrysis_carterae.AAC.3
MPICECARRQVRGGVEMGFMSTTASKEVAMAYAGSHKKAAVVFEIQMGMLDRGANLSWISQCARRTARTPHRPRRDSHRCLLFTSSMRVANLFTSLFASPSSSM